MNIHFEKDISIVEDNKYEIHSYYFRLHDGGINSVLVNQKYSLNPISVLHEPTQDCESYFCSLDHEGYIIGLETFLKNLQDKYGDPFFNDQMLKEIIDSEKRMDGRYTEKIRKYIRVLKFLWFSKLGAYVDIFDVVCFAKEQDRTPARYCFLVESFYQKENGKLESKRKKDYGKIFPEKPKNSFNLGFKNVVSIPSRLNKGFESTNIKFFEESFKLFFKTLNGKDSWDFRNNLEMMFELSKTKTNNEANSES